MHVLFVHKNFPAQFGHIAARLVQDRDCRCTFVSEKPAGVSAGVERIQYTVQGGAQQNTHYCSRTFENQIWHSAAVLQALTDRPDVQPDLIVGHSGFLSTIFLRELYDAPQINYFEFFYRVVGSDFDFRSDLPAPGMPERIRARIRNAGLLLDLENCNAGYSPTRWQHSQLPDEFQSKIDVIFDGIDTDFWKPQPVGGRTIGGWKISPEQKVVTYVSRGLESIRGFDVFMQVAQRICQQRSDVVFVVVGEDRIAYGGDQRFTGKQTFKQWVLQQREYDLQRILFLGRIPPAELVRLFNLTDLHLFLTVPFVLSWSLFDALSCGATVLASDTPPVQELVRNDVNGLLTDFFDVDDWIRRVNAVLDDPASFQHLGAYGRQTILERYSMSVCLPRIENLYRSTAASADPN